MESNNPFGMNVGIKKSGRTLFFMHVGLFRKKRNSNYSLLSHDAFPFVSHQNYLQMCIL